MDYLISGTDWPFTLPVKEVFQEIGYSASLSDEMCQQLVGVKIVRDYNLLFLPLMPKDEKVLFSSKMMIALFEPEKPKERAQFYYDVPHHHLEKGIAGEGLYIACYSNSQLVKTSDYLHAIEMLHQLSTALHRPLVILGHIWPELTYDVDEAVLQEILGKYMKKYKSLILCERLPSEKNQARPLAQPLLPLVENWGDVQKYLKKYLNEPEGLRGLSVDATALRLVHGRCALSSALENTSCFQGQSTYIGCIVPHETSLKAMLTNQEIIGRIAWLWDENPLKEENEKMPYDLIKWLELMGAVASKAQFIIARLAQTEVSISDIQIATDKLVHKAQLDKKPLILLIPYIPYLTRNVAYESWLSHFAVEPGHILVIPAGDDGGRGAYIKKNTKKDEVLRWQMRGEQETINCHLQAEACGMYEVILTDPEGKSYTLTDPESECLKLAGIQTTGIYVHPQTGEEELVCSISQAIKGNWEFKVYKRIKEMGSIGGWLNDSLPSPRAYWQEPCCLGTLISLGPYCIRVGSFAEKADTLYGFSARADSQAESLMAVSDSCFSDGQMTSTMEAACLMTGVLACFYEKLVKEQPEVNTVYLMHRLMPLLSRTHYKQYPDPGQGWGILDKASLCRLLEEEERL